MRRGGLLWLAIYVLSQLGLYLTVKVSVSSLGLAAYLPVYLLGSSAPLIALSRGRLSLDEGAVKLGLMQALSAALWLVGMYYLQPASAAALSYFMPFVAMLIGYVALGEGVSAREGLGAAIAAVGVGVYTAYSVTGSLKVVGAAAALANTAAWASYSIYYRKLRGRDPVRLNASSLLLAGLVTLPALSMARDVRLTSLATASIIVVSLLVSALGYVSWNRLVTAMSVPRATLLSYAAPAAVAVAQYIMGSPLRTMQAVGLTVMIVGALVTFGG